MLISALQTPHCRGIVFVISSKTSAPTAPTTTTVATAAAAAAVVAVSLPVAESTTTVSGVVQPVPETPYVPAMPPKDSVTDLVAETASRLSIACTMDTNDSEESKSTVSSSERKCAADSSQTGNKSESISEPVDTSHLDVFQAIKDTQQKVIRIVKRSIVS